MFVAAAVDLGATNVRCALVTEGGGCFSLQHRVVHGMQNGADIVSLIGDMIEEACVDSGLVPSVIGISAAGPIDLSCGAVVGSPNMSAEEIILTEPLSCRFGIPAVLLTDCKAAVFGEYLFGCGRGVENLVYLTFSTGIGCGVLQKGRIFSGADGNAGEVGHFPVDFVYDVSCGCGGSGHWEAYCSGTGIPKFFLEWNKRHGLFSADECVGLLSAKEILSAASSGDERFSGFLEDVSVMNVRGILTVICAYNPEMIVLDGPLVHEYFDLLYSKAMQCAGQYLRAPEFKVSKMSGSAPLLGAGAYALRVLRGER